jgi:methylisocitrate lyase
VAIGRTDARSSEGIDRALERAVRYCEADVDMIFINSLETEEEMRKATRLVPKPVKINVIEGYPPSRFTSAQLLGFGFELVGYAGMMQRAAGRGMLACLQAFRKEDTTEGTLKELLMTPAERYEVLEVAKFKARTSKSNSRTNEPLHGSVGRKISRLAGRRVNRQRTFILIREATCVFCRGGGSLSPRFLRRPAS